MPFIQVKTNAEINTNDENLIKSYGKASSDAYDKLTYEITNLISNTLNIPSTRIYVSYFETPNWGFAGSNF